jgi:hypothetical protein
LTTIITSNTLLGNTIEATMAPTNAERQAVYRQRHLQSGSDARVSFIISATAKAALERLATHRGLTQRAMLETLLTQAEAAATRRMTPAAKSVYCNGKPKAKAAR